MPATTNTKCNYCNKVFQKLTKHYNEAKKYRWKMYCSKECYKDAKSKRLSCFCSNPECGKRFIKAHAELSENNYCSHKCAAVINNRKRKGIKFNVIIENNNLKIISIPKTKACTNGKCKNQTQVSKNTVLTSANNNTRNCHLNIIKLRH